MTLNESYHLTSSKDSFYGHLPISFSVFQVTVFPRIFPPNFMQICYIHPSLTTFPHDSQRVLPPHIFQRFLLGSSSNLLLSLSSDSFPRIFPPDFMQICYINPSTTTFPHDSQRVLPPHILQRFLLGPSSNFLLSLSSDCFPKNLPPKLHANLSYQSICHYIST